MWWWCGVVGGGGGTCAGGCGGGGDSGGDGIVGVGVVVTAFVRVAVVIVVGEL